MLKPHEEITILRLSAGQPKEENQLSVYSVDMGPSTMNDLLVVETSDHAKLYLKITYNYFLDIDRDNPS